MIKQFDKVVLKTDINLPNFAPWQIQLWAALTCSSNVHSNSLGRIKQRMIDYDLIFGRLEWRFVAQVIWEHFWVRCLVSVLRQGRNQDQSEIKKLTDRQLPNRNLAFGGFSQTQPSRSVSDRVTGLYRKYDFFGFFALLCLVSAIMCWLSFLFLLSFTKNLCCDSA